MPVWLFWGGGIANNKLPEQEIIKNENINLAIYLNEIETSSIPSKEGNVFDEEKSTCTNDAYIVWDYSSWSPIIKNVSNYPVRCNLYFKTEYSESILNGTDPILKDELIPVTISDDGTVRKADLGSKWYSYEEKIWANAVILEEFDLFDLSENHYNGRLMNGAKIITDSSGNNAISFDGIDDYVDIVDISASTNWEDGFTIEFEATWNEFTYFGRIFDFSSKNKDYVIFAGNNGSTNGIIIGGRGGNPEEKLDNYMADQIIEGQRTKIKFIYRKENSNLYIDYYKDDKLITTFDQNGKEFKNQAYINNYLGKSAWTDLTDENSDRFFNGLLYSLKITDANNQTILWYDLNKNEKNESVYKTNEIIPESAIESYFVWIPKYRYQLWDLGMYDSLTSIDTTKVHEIPVIFGDYNTSDNMEGECTTPMESGATGNCSIGDYMTHPAFLSIPSKGFWVGKFETGYDGATTKAEAEVNVNDPSKIIIKPNVQSWRNNQISNIFNMSYMYYRNLDSHPMKNTEWGAVAYLQHSKYGSATSVRLNNNSDFKTGYAALNEPTCGYSQNNEECNIYCNDNSCNSVYPESVLASTTNNISGIFDMSGGAWEYMMGVLLDEEGNPFSGSNERENSGFNGNYGMPNEGEATSLINGLSWPEKKYYDTYIYADEIFDYYNRILGDATSEMGPFAFAFSVSVSVSYSKSGWYDDFSNVLFKRLVWYARGAANPGYQNGVNGGIFSFAESHGGANPNGTFRLVLTPT